MIWIFYGFIFLLGGILYQTLELFWRRRTHPSMFWAGGTCAVLLELLCNNVFFGLPLLLRCLTGALVITLVEFSFGCVVNLRLGWNVWDYSTFRFHFMGQICPLYSSLWAIVSLPALTLLNFLRKLIV